MTNKPKEEILKLKDREDRYTNAYSEGVIALGKLKEYLAPLKEKISFLEKNLTQAYSEQNTKSEITFPGQEEMEIFAKEATDLATSSGLAK